MLINIDDIKVNDRIRKDFGNIEELAKDIEENGLINPPVITPDKQLIAGERRLRACKLLGWKQIEVRVMAVRDAEHQLKLEITENENRKDFTFSEKMEWARRLERIERAKAEERMKNPTQNFAEGKGETNEIVAKQTGFGNRENYRKAKFIADHADEETIRQLDAGEISIHKAYTETKRKLEEAERKLTEMERSLRVKNAELSALEEAARTKELEIAKYREALEKAKREQPEPKVITREVVKEVVPESIKQKMRAIEKEKEELENSLRQSYERIRELERLERSVKNEMENPLYDIYRSLSGTVGYLKVFLENRRFAMNVVANVDRGLLYKIRKEIDTVMQLGHELREMIDQEKNVIEVIVDDEN